MTRRRSPQVPEVDGIDLDFRPHSYWADHDPIAAITQNMKGQNRRVMARDFIAGDMPKAFGAINDELLEDTLDDSARVSLGQTHPSFMGGEYLPDYDCSEVEIARVVLASSTQDVYSVRARCPQPGARIRYRMLDEYNATFTLKPASSTRPLSLRELISLVDSAESEELDTMGWPFVEGFAAWQVENGESASDAIDFVSVESSVYAELGAYYAERLCAWAAAQKEEPEDDEDGSDDDDDESGDAAESE